MHALLRTLGVVVAAIALGCSPDPQSDPAPLDRFTYPVGLAVRGQDLLVVSSNFDLRYATADGGSLLEVALTDPPALQPGGVRIGSFGGEITVIEAGQCGLTAPQALVTSRLSNRLYRVGLGGGVSCGPGCEVSFEDDVRLASPYGVVVTCPPGGPNRAWVGFLGTPLRQAFLASIDLDQQAAAPGVAAAGREVVSTGAGQVRSFAYDETARRLFFTSVETVLSAPLRWLELGDPSCDPALPENQGGCVLRAADLWGFIRGAELAGLGLSNPVAGRPQRIYVAARVFDPDLAATLGIRPGFDVAGRLMVLEAVENATGVLDVKLVRTLDVGLGAAEVRVLPRRPDVGGKPQRDLVAITSSEDGLLWIYDDEAGAMRDVFGRDPRTGEPAVGSSPFGLAVQDLRATPGAGDGNARVYVGSFLDGFVSAVDVPLSGSAPAALVGSGPGSSAPLRIGQVTP